MAKRPVDPPRPGDGHLANSRTLIERAYRRLREDIVQGHLPPGQKLRVEHLKGDYQVGASTLREALARLVSDALVTAEGQRGFTVSPMTVDELEDLTNVRVMLETTAVQEAIRRGDDAWRESLTRTFEQVSAFPLPLTQQTALQWEAANAAFHDALLAGGASPWTLRLLRQLNSHAERYRRLSIRLSATHRNVHAEHREIFDSALEGRSARAALALEVHIRTTPDVMIRALRSGEVSMQELRP